MDFYASLDPSQLDQQKPTIFEVASCSQVDNLLTPSLRFLLVHYTHRYPRLLIRVLNNFDGLNALLRGFIEYKYLQKWNATFVEKFYGIKRVTSSLLVTDSSISESEKLANLKRLSKLQILASLFESVIAPYLSTKLQLYHEKLVPQYLLNNVRINEVEGKPEETKTAPFTFLVAINKLKRGFRDLFYKIYPLTRLGVRLATLAIYILYLTNKTSSISIVQLLFKISYSRITKSDHERAEKSMSLETVPQIQKQNVPPTLSSTVHSKLLNLAQPLRKFAWSTTDTILPMSIFLLKFLEWYNSNQSKLREEHSETFIPNVPTIVPADTLNDETIREKVSSADDGVCRICLEPIHNPGFIETGYVFCYKCIYEYLRDQSKEDGGKCPVTGRRLLGCTWNEPKKEWTVRGVRRLIV
ncbi:hypothetical protein CAS74_000913 [Pichia kudriavzevii]|uniref:Peroxisome assembly protein 12 n=1 Tax=Pichia kudriavzevii TaxID=4909 RepID=A0A1Z8JVA0_PICKU|nr:hypothetical protein CAS74_000913 [Pichia kudriavzevii]